MFLHLVKHWYSMCASVSRHLKAFNIIWNAKCPNRFFTACLRAKSGHIVECKYDKNALMLLNIAIPRTLNTKRCCDAGRCMCTYLSIYSVHVHTAGKQRSALLFLEITYQAKLYSSDRVAQLVQWRRPAHNTHHVGNNQQDPTCDSRLGWQTDLQQGKQTSYITEDQLFLSAEPARLQ